jgi:hypothetical protein
MITRSKPMSATTIDLTSDTTLRVTLTASLVALFFSGWAFIASFSDDANERDLERRIACLELHGANDCGADGR